MRINTHRWLTEIISSRVCEGVRTPAEPRKRDRLAGRLLMNVCENLRVHNFGRLAQRSLKDIRRSLHPTLNRADKNYNYVIGNNCYSVVSLSRYFLIFISALEAPLMINILILSVKLEAA